MVLSPEVRCPPARPFPPCCGRVLVPPPQPLRRAARPRRSTGAAPAGGWTGGGAGPVPGSGRGRRMPALAGGVVRGGPSTRPGRGGPVRQGGRRAGGGRPLPARRSSHRAGRTSLHGAPPDGGARRRGPGSRTPVVTPLPRIEDMSHTFQVDLRGLVDLLSHH